MYVCASVCLSICLSVCLSVCERLYVCMSVSVLCLCVLAYYVYDMSVILSMCVRVCMCRVVYVLCIHECLGVCYHGMA